MGVAFLTAVNCHHSSKVVHFPGLGAGVQASLRFQSLEGGSGPGGRDMV